MLGLCETPGSVTIVGTGDGEVFSGTAVCDTIVSPVSGTKCGNGVVDAAEDCEDGNTAAGDCCSPACLFDPPGTACTADLDSCTLDQCDGAGQCQHPSAPPGTACTDDGNECTDDVCDAGAACTHPANTGPCDDGNACTTADTCATGSCVGGPIAPECAGALDLSGAWELVGPPPGPVALPGVMYFAQSGAVLQANLPGFPPGVGSVDPATGDFLAMTPFTFLVASCVQAIEGTASADGRTFSGSTTVYCGLDGTFGPVDVAGRLCPGATCACPTSALCTRADTVARVTVRMRDGKVATRWRWKHSALAPGFGDPTVDTDYEICLETPDGAFVETAQGGAWRATHSGFLYRDRSGPIRRLSLRANEKRTALAATILGESSPSLPLTTPLRLRLLQHTGGTTSCLEAEFADPSVSTASRFRATD